jgi:hydrogenase maturation protein HypF
MDNGWRSKSSSICRLAITVRGVVQGVGFRPFVYNMARRLGLRGWVYNEASAVRMEVQGGCDALKQFLDVLENHAPPQAAIDSLEVAEIPIVSASQNADSAAFEIRESNEQALPRPTIPADLATCADCLTEINDPNQRRYQYPFTNCTNCGPRWSIIRELPYDRSRTSMAGFAMCPECEAEYRNPSDRRFHAQPIACPRCGPRLQLLDPQGHELAVGDAALRATAEALLAGRIVALKGLGGFQLLVDATNAEAVARLRQRKHRPDRPFAVMATSLDSVRQYCEVDDSEARILASHQSPIVLMQGRGGLARILPIVDGVAPGNPYLGILMQAVARPVVCTSGNLAEEPMVIATEDALRRLGPIADLVLTHNRPIVRPVDDSIVRVGMEERHDGIHVLRRARGFAPLPLRIAIPMPTDHRNLLAEEASSVLAVGGHLKNTVALCLGTPQSRELREDAAAAQVVMSSHIGDLDSIRSVEVFRTAIDDLLGFFHAKPQVIACDLHPDYASTRHAETLASRWGIPLLRVQHHHAHVAACMAENGLAGAVLGLAWDGTGYGTDGSIWGGEALLCERGSFERVAHLRTFALPGGDRAVRQPRRSAFALLHEILGEHASEAVATLFAPNDLNLLNTMLARRLQSPRTSSMGRLFDGVAALCGLPPVISFEGQAAMALEFAAEATEAAGDAMAESDTEAYAFALRPGEASQSNQPTKSPLVVDWEPVVRRVLDDRARGIPAGRIASRFHNALANMALEVAVRIGCRQIALTGGCFQNALLANRVQKRLAAGGFDVYTHRRTPPGDGGIALGQAFLALQQL